MLDKSLLNFWYNFSVY